MRVSCQRSLLSAAEVRGGHGATTDAPQVLLSPEARWDGCRTANIIID